ncbi:nitronate monooxygenase family protein [Paenibacillus sp. JCM 10914]|uniref:NAD(P)H-dependent flavin oxidoreductase n=1 Tax=Paenibacillus sp. JCM 10914 TaxID=1236974 RepID=UPI0003CC8473|nr:nitronate monooxygenase [Paenibacillus sp. JCM 10914]GAE08048.1 permease of the drug/metabolite transporter [Paenibacillus sp. JCM 10914]
MSIQLNSKFCESFNIRYPIVLAGMAGIANMVTLVTAVSNAGGLGTLGAAYMNPEELREAVREIKQHTHAPFAVNIFAHVEPDQYINFDAVNKEMDSIRESLGVKRRAIDEIRTPHDFEEQFDILLDEQVPVISTTFGLLSEHHMEQAQSLGIKIMGTVTTVEEAIQAEKRGCDVIVAQGSEAGGHRGTFDVTSQPNGANIGTMALVPQIVDHVHIPVIAAGGIMDGRGVVASLALGAQGVQMGTRFLTSVESGAHEVYKRALLDSTENSTVMTNAFSGRPARGIRNDFIQQWEASHIKPLPFPTQNTLTREIRNASARQNNPAYMALWAGQGTRMLTSNQSAEAIINQIVEEVRSIIPL